jgi:hypothetical protein
VPTKVNFLPQNTTVIKMHTVQNQQVHVHGILVTT